jgi:ketosteroid isomerase-like protein
MSLRCSTLVLSVLASACMSGPRLEPLTDRDREAIASLETSFAKMASTGGFKALVDLYYADDAMLLAPNAPPAKGRAAIEATLSAFPPITAFSLKANEIDGAGDVAYSYGNYSLSMKTPGGTVVDEGKSVVIYRRQPGGGWKAWRDIFNSSLPAQVAAAEPRK